MADATLPHAELIERSDGWLTVIDEGDGGWRAIGPFLSEPEAVAAARSVIGETGLIDVRHRDEARPRDDIEDLADVADAETADRARDPRGDAIRERGAGSGGAPTGDLDNSI
jgi:hypothetical protein